MRKLILAVVLTSACLLLASTGYAKNLYVNNSGTPACSDATTYAVNDADNPWCTLLRATWGNTTRTGASTTAQAAQAADIVYVTAGTYEATKYSSGSFGGAPLYEPANAGTSGNLITFEAVGVVNLTTTTPGVSTTGAPIIGSNKEYIVWKGFSIDQASVAFRQGNAVVAVRASHVTLEDLVLTGAYTDYGFDDNHAGIMLHGPRDETCTGEIEDITVKNCTIHGFTGTNGSNDTGMTMYCLGQTLLEHNEIYSNNSGIYYKQAYNTANTSIVRYNLIYSNTTGIRYKTWTRHNIYQNVIRDNSTGVHLHAHNGSSSGDHPSYTYIVNNTLDNNTRSIYIEGDCPDFHDNYVYNNIGTNATNTIFNEDAACQTTANIGTDDIDFDYNVWENSGYFWMNDGSAEVATWATWQSSYGQNDNSSNSADCLYTNESGNDFTLQAGSPCREGQANDGVDILDLDEDSSTVDAITIGAYITGYEEIGLEGGLGAPTVSGCTITGGSTAAP